MSSNKKKPRMSVAKQNARIEHISIAGVTARMGPIGLHTYADAFLKAAQALPPPSVPFEPVRHFLVCRSIELALKAFLSLLGSTMLKLAERDGHNLEALLRNAEEKGFAALVPIDEPQRQAIRRASVYYEGKVFEYPAVGEALSGYPQLPTLDLLLAAASVLVNSLREPCLKAE
jgi:hypothetical protein